LAAITGVSVSKTEAAWPFKKKTETKTERKINENSARVISALSVFEDESKDAKIIIMKKGETLAVVAGGATVKTNTSGVLTVDVEFGISVMALTVKTTANTKVFRHYDGKGSTVAEISGGDIISFNGALDTTAASLTVTADKIKDYSMQRAGANSNYGGVVSELNIEEGSDGKVGSFRLPLANQPNQPNQLGNFITVFVNATTKIASTTPGLKLSDMKNGDFVVRATGIVNTQKRELRATHIKFSTKDVFINNPMTINKIKTIKTGTSFGKCVGYCKMVLDINSKSISYIKSGWDNSSYPEVQRKIQISPKEWNSLVNALNVKKFNLLPERIGCPDCADGGAEWIEISDGKTTKKVTFEYGASISEIDSFIKKLRKLEELFQK